MSPGRTTLKGWPRRVVNRQRKEIPKVQTPQQNPDLQLIPALKPDLQKVRKVILNPHRKRRRPILAHRMAGKDPGPKSSLQRPKKLPPEEALKAGAKRRKPLPNRSRRQWSRRRLSCLVRSTRR